jgi:DNA-binding transcriptional ArsR family regulator
MLPIRQNLLTLTCLKSNAKTVLIEVCELAENGKKGGCFASNATLSADLGMSLATVVRTVATLVEAGLLTTDVVKAEGNRRYLRPTARLRACYTGGTEAQQLAVAAELTIVKKQPKAELTIVKNDIDYSQNGELTIVKNDTDYSQNASRVYGDDQYDQVTTKDDQPPTPEEWVWAQKKIAELESENAKLKAKILGLVPPVAAPPQKPAVETQGPQHSEASKALAAEMAGLWHLTQQGNARKWMQLARFTHEMEQAGRLAEVSRQFTGYALYREKRGIEPYNLDKYLGSEGDGYRGEWCAFDWSAKAQQAKANGETPNRPGQPTPTPARAGGSPSQAAAYRPR